MARQSRRRWAWRRIPSGGWSPASCCAPEPRSKRLWSRARSSICRPARAGPHPLARSPWPHPLAPSPFRPHPLARSPWPPPPAPSPFRRRGNEGDDVAGLFEDLEAQRLAPADPDAIPGAALVPPREPDELLRLLIGNLREKSAERVAARQAVAEKEVAKELDRLDRYFAAILADNSDSEEARTITALHERRRTEEVRRHQVKAIVHPLQLVEARVLVQRAEWELRSTHGRRAQLA